MFNLLSTSGLALPVRRTLRGLVEEVVEGQVAKAMAEVARVSELLSNDEVSTNFGFKVVKAEKRHAEAQELANHSGMRLMRYQEGNKVVDAEMRCLLQEGFDLRDEIGRLKAGKVSRGVDKGTRMSTKAVRPSYCLSGVQAEWAGVCVRVQTEVMGVSTVGVMTDVSNVQVVWKTTYVSMASQAVPEVVTRPAGVDVGMGGWGMVLLGLSCPG